MRKFILLSTHKFSSLYVLSVALIVSKHFMFFFCIPVRRNWILCQHGIPCVGVRACCSPFVSLSLYVSACMFLSASCSCPRRRMYVSHFSFIALWHLFMIARPQHNSQTAKGVLKNDMYSRHNYRVVVFSVAFAMVTRKYIYRVQLHVHKHVCVCVCDICRITLTSACSTCIFQQYLCLSFFIMRTS